MTKKAKHHSKYTNQVILLFADHKIKEMQRLKSKWDRDNDSKSCLILIILPEDDISKWNAKFSALSLLTPKSRLYITAHCLAGSSHIYASADIKSDIKYSSEQLANFLALYLKDKSFSLNTGVLLKISILACEAGRGKKKLDYFGSFAADFHVKLRNKNIISLGLSLEFQS